MAGSTTAEIPGQRTEDAKKMAILLACPSGEDPRRAAGGKPPEADTRQRATTRSRRQLHVQPPSE